MSTQRRYATLALSGALLESWLKVGFRSAKPVENCLPADARIVGADFSARWGATVTLTFESQSFEPVREGEVAPELNSPVFEALP